MRSQITSRLRSCSITTLPPPPSSVDYSHTLAQLAVQILYRSPLPSHESSLPVFILNSAAFPDTKAVDYDALLPYVLARLPGEDELIQGPGYEIVFFAGGGSSGNGSRKGRPGAGWFLQAYHKLTRVVRKRLQKLYVVHERNWIRVLVEVFSTIVSPKFRRKIVHRESRVFPAWLAYRCRERGRRVPCS